MVVTMVEIHTVDKMFARDLKTYCTAPHLKLGDGKMSCTLCPSKIKFLNLSSRINKKYNVQYVLHYQNISWSLTRD